MPILASRLQATIASSLDAGAGSSTGQNRYTFPLDYKFAINFAARKLLEWATTHQGSQKFNSEALRELRHIWVFQTSNYSRVEIPATVNTINAVYPEITSSPASPSLIGNDTAYVYDLDFHGNALGDTTSMIFNYNGIEYAFDATPSNTDDVRILMEDFFNDQYGLDLGDEFDDYLDIITVTSQSGTIYGDIVFKDIYEEIIATISPTVVAYTQLNNWSSFLRPDIVFTDAVKDANRTTDEERAKRRNNPFAAGYSASTAVWKQYGYSEITDFNSSSYTPTPNRILKEVQIYPARARAFVAIALVENYTDVAVNTDFVTMPEQFFNLLVDLGQIWIRFKQDNELMTTAANQLLINSVKNYNMQ